MKKQFESEAVRILQRDHKRVQDLLFHFEQSETASHKLSFAETVLNEVAVHSVIEEECIYPLLEELEKKKLSKRVHRSAKEHGEIDEVMTRLVAFTEYNAEYDKLFNKLADKLNEHIEEEEEDLLPALDAIATPELADEMNRLKTELTQLDETKAKDFSPQVLLFDKMRARRTA